MSKDASGKTEIKVETEEDANEVTVKVAKKDSDTSPYEEEEDVKENKASNSGLDEAKEWYWDYDNNCWKECDPNEEYEWEYIDDEDNVRKIN